MIEKEPDTIFCYFCSTPGMEKKHRAETRNFVRVLWQCSRCGHEYWKDYGEKEALMYEKRGGISGS